MTQYTFFDTDSGYTFKDKVKEEIKAKKRGRMSIPIESQIRGIKKALENPKTPAQLKAGLKKRLKTLGG